MKKTATGTSNSASSGRSHTAPLLSIPCQATVCLDKPLPPRPPPLRDLLLRKLHSAPSLPPSPTVTLGSSPAAISPSKSQPLYRSHALSVCVEQADSFDVTGIEQVGFSHSISQNESLLDHRAMSSLAEAVREAFGVPSEPFESSISPSSSPSGSKAESPLTRNATSRRTPTLRHKIRQATRQGRGHEQVSSGRSALREFQDTPNLGNPVHRARVPHDVQSPTPQVRTLGNTSRMAYAKQDSGGNVPTAMATFSCKTEQELRASHTPQERFVQRLIDGAETDNPDELDLYITSLVGHEEREKGRYVKRWKKISSEQTGRHLECNVKHAGRFIDGISAVIRREMDDKPEITSWI